MPFYLLFCVPLRKRIVPLLGIFLGTINLTSSMEINSLSFEEKDVIIILKHQQYQVNSAKIMQVSPTIKSDILHSRSVITLSKNYEPQVFSKFIDFVNGGNLKLDANEIPGFYEICTDLKCKKILEILEKNKNSNFQRNNDENIIERIIADSLSGKSTFQTEAEIANRLKDFIKFPQFQHIPIQSLMRIYFAGGYKADPSTLTDFFSICFKIDKQSSIYMLHFLNQGKEWTTEQCATFSRNILTSEFPLLQYFVEETAKENQQLLDIIDDQNLQIQRLQEANSIQNMKIEGIQKENDNLRIKYHEEQNRETAKKADIFDCINRNEIDKIRMIIWFEETITKLKEKRNFDSRSIYPLHYAVINGNYDAVICILSVVSNPSNRQHDEYINDLTSDFLSPLHLCVDLEPQDIQFKIALELMEHGADIDRVPQPTNPQSMSPLMFAVDKGKEEIARHFLNINIKNKKPKVDRTKLLFKALQKRIEITDLILQTHCGDIRQLVNSSENSLTPLNLAIQFGLFTSTKLLIENGADLLGHSKDGWTPLHRAAVANDSNILKFIISRYKDVNPTDSLGQTPIFLAAQYSQVENFRLLLQCGGYIKHPNKFGQTLESYTINEKIKELIKELK